MPWAWEEWIARPSQKEPDGRWLYWLILSGRGYGKTRMGAEWVRRQVQKYDRIGLIGKDAADMRDVMIEGESGILSVFPPDERPIYKASKREIYFPKTGAIAHCRTGEDPEGVRGIQFARVWCDEIAAWQYPQETWDMVLLATRLGDDVRLCVTTTPKPIRLLRDLIKDDDCVVTRGSTYENLPNLAPTYRTVIARYEGTRLGQQELLGELLEDEGLAYKFSERIHVVPPFQVPVWWERFESVDYGWANPSAWLAWGADDLGNIVVFDMVYEAGWPSILVPKVQVKRRNGWQTGRPNSAYADPSTWNKASTTPRFGDPASAADEFAQLGVPLVKANNDRRAGFLRLSELFRQDPMHQFPEWHPKAGEPGAPRLYVMDVPGTLPLREQIADAPLEEQEGPNRGPHPGEAVAVRWESGKGHAHAALRYGAMTRPAPSDKPEAWKGIAPPLRPDYLLSPDQMRRDAIAEFWAKREKELSRPFRRRRTERV